MATLNIEAGDPIRGVNSRWFDDTQAQPNRLLYIHDFSMDDHAAESAKCDLAACDFGKSSLRAARASWRLEDHGRRFGR